MRPKFTPHECFALILVLSLLITMGIKEPRFFGPAGINSVLLLLPMLLVAAMGQLLVILTRGIDVSVGSALGLVAISVGLALKSNPDLPVIAAFLMGAGLGALLGFLNGVLVTYGKLSPVVVTIAMLAAFRGLSFVLSGGEQIDPSMVPSQITKLATQGFDLGRGTVSVLLMVALAVALVTGTVLAFTRFGRNVYATGSNPEAAYLRGVNTRSVLIAVYVLSGLTAGLAGVMYAARYGFVNPGTAGQNFELNVIAAVAIGGTKITGGRGTVAGTVLGCILLSCVNVTLVMLGVEADWQLLTYGAIILLAVIAGGAIDRLWPKAGSKQAVGATP